MDKQPHQLAEEAKSAYAAGKFAQAAQAFRLASQGYTHGRDGLHAAEMNNNLSVALLKNKQPKEALEAALGTEKTFAMQGDKARAGMALGNQAAALEALKRYDEAVTRYQESADLFGESGERDLQSLSIKAIANIRLKRGQLNQAGIDMIGSLGAAEHPTMAQRILKFLLRFLR